MSGEPNYSVRAPDRDSRREQVPDSPVRRQSPDDSEDPVRYEASGWPGPAASDRRSIEAPPDDVVESPGGGGDA
jgi:hypothetical protein